FTQNTAGFATSVQTTSSASASPAATGVSSNMNFSSPSSSSMDTRLKPQPFSVIDTSNRSSSSKSISSASMSTLLASRDVLSMSSSWMSSAPFGNPSPATVWDRSSTSNSTSVSGSESSPEQLARNMSIKRDKLLNKNFLFRKRH